MSRQHADVRDLLPLYALGALEGTEDCEVVCSHLATGCPDCAAELASHARAASALPAALPPIAPRADVRAALEKKLAAAPRAPGADVIPLDAARRGATGGKRVSWVWAAAASAAAAAAFVAAVNLREQLRWERRQHVIDATEIADLGAELSRANRALAKDEALLEAIGNGDATVFALGATKDQTGTGHIVWNKKDRTWTLLASGMKPLSKDQVYELWFIEDGKDPRSAVRFEPDKNGFVRQTVTLPADMLIAANVKPTGAITLEPRADSDPKPSGIIVIAGKAG